MKKNVIIPVVILIVILIVGAIIAGVQYKQYQNKKLEIQSFNLTYEAYNTDNLNGLDVTTLINKAVSNNEKYYVEKDDEGLYDLEDENCIEIYITMIINGTTYRMERINNLGIEAFIEYFGEVSFKCANITYREDGRISSMTLEAQEY